MVKEPIQLAKTILMVYGFLFEFTIFPTIKPAKTKPIIKPKLGFIMDCTPPVNPAKIGSPISPKNM